MKNYFIVIDMQNDFIDGSLANQDAQKIVPKISHALNNLSKYGFNSSETKLLFTMDTHYDNYLETPEGKNLPIKHCINGTHGHLISESIIRNIPSTFETDFIKKTSFAYLNWNDHIDESTVENIIICGTCTDICVVSNALILKALYPNANISVISDLCAGLTPDAHTSALVVMRNCQISIR